MKCANCTNPNTVFCGAGGDPESDFVILGESPGRTELKEGQPFSPRGDTGFFIRKEAAKMNFCFDKCFHLNSVNCDVNSWQDDAKRMKAMECRQRVYDQICAKPRKFILTLGAPALVSITGNQDIGIIKHRGGAAKIFACDKHGWQAYMLHTFHPSPKSFKTDNSRKMHFIIDMRKAIVLYRSLPNIKITT